MSLGTAIRIGVKDATDKVMGLGKAVAGMVTADRDLREEGAAQLDQAHVEPEAAAVVGEDQARERESGRLRRLREL